MRTITIMHSCSLEKVRLQGRTINDKGLKMIPKSVVKQTRFVETLKPKRFLREGCREDVCLEERCCCSERMAFNQRISNQKTFLWACSEYAYRKDKGLLKTSKIEEQSAVENLKKSLKILNRNYNEIKAEVNGEDKRYLGLLCLWSTISEMIQRIQSCKPLSLSPINAAVILNDGGAFLIELVPVICTLDIEFCHTLSFLLID